MTNTVYFAAGAPGSGKTENLLNQAQAMAKKGKNLLIATPKKELCKELGDRLTKKKTAHTIITEDEITDCSVSFSIKEKLATANNEILIITHAALFLLEHTTVSDLVIVIDETPNLLEFHKISMPNNEWDRLFHYVEESDNTLKIITDKEAEIREKNKRYKSDQGRTKGNQKSALSHNEHLILDALLKNRTVAIRKGESKTQAQVINDDNLHKLKAITKNAKEVHLLAANIAGGLFETLATASNITIDKSPLGVKNHNYNKDITIYTLFKSPPSKSKLLVTRSGKKLATHVGIPFYQHLDIALNKAITNAPTIHPYTNLVFTHDWAKLDESESTLIILSPECRGLNQYSKHHVAICLFHGNASPMDALCLDLIANRMEISSRKLRDAWNVTYKLERTLQCSTRTSVRSEKKICKLNRKLKCKEQCECNNGVYLYVQDIETANYLKETCMLHAVIDRSLETEFIKHLEESKTTKKEQSALQIIMGNEHKGKKIILEELINTGMSTATAYRYYNRIKSNSNNQNSQNP